MITVVASMTLMVTMASMVTMAPMASMVTKASMALMAQLVAASLMALVETTFFGSEESIEVGRESKEDGDTCSSGPS